jgi:hypothetical protein
LLNVHRRFAEGSPSIPSKRSKRSQPIQSQRIFNTTPPQWAAFSLSPDALIDFTEHRGRSGPPSEGAHSSHWATLTSGRGRRTGEHNTQEPERRPPEPAHTQPEPAHTPQAQAHRQQEPGRRRPARAHKPQEPGHRPPSEAGEAAQNKQRLELLQKQTLRRGDDDRPNDQDRLHSRIHIRLRSQRKPRLRCPLPSFRR